MISLANLQLRHPNGLLALEIKSPLTANSGECVALVGPSGAGKSTLLNYLRGLFQQEAVFIAQNPYAQLVTATVEEELVWGAENVYKDFSVISDRVTKASTHFRLESLFGRETRTLSGGECQRLIVASALTTSPSILLLDEPCAFLDRKAKRELYQLLHRLKGHQTLFLVDHHLDEMKELADRFWVFTEEGDVFESKTLPDFLTETLSLEEKGHFVQEREVQKRLDMVDLSFSYNDLPLFTDLNLSLKEGDILLIAWDNGKGKSTLLKILASTLSPQIGHTKTSFPKDDVAWLLQNPELHFCFDSVEEELLFCKKKISLDGLGFSKDQLKRSPFLLSEGEKRRLSFYIVSELNKSLYLFDEPTFGQDHKNRLMMLSTFLKLQSAGKIQIIVTHDTKLINSLRERERVFLWE